MRNMSIDRSYGGVPQWTLGDRLRKARTETGMTVAEFAEHIGVSTRTINSAENDQRAVRKITLNAWSLATGVDIEWLETGRATEGGGDTDPGSGVSLDTCEYLDRSCHVDGGLAA